MTSQIDDAVDQVLGSGLARADQNELMRQLDAELQQQAHARAMVLSADEPAPWVTGGIGAGGFGSMAQRFLSFYSEALHREICDPGGGLKDQYRQLLGGSDTRAQVQSLTPTVLKIIGVGASLVNPATIGVILALWLLRVGLEQWCASSAYPTPSMPPAPGDQPPAPAASSPASGPGSGAAPQPIDPSITPTSPHESGAGSTGDHP